MENENKIKEQVGPYKKSKDIVITQNQLKIIVIAISILIIAFLAFAYFNSGLTHKKAKEVFVDYWNNKNPEKLEEVKILGIKKIKTDSCLVKIQYSYLFNDFAERPDGKPVFGYYFSNLSREEYAKQNGLEMKIRKIENKKDYIYTKWDTGWFIEEKKK